MRKTFLYIVCGQLATIAIPAVAQDTMSEPTPPPTAAEETDPGALTPDQMAAVDAWPAAQRAEYEGWPAETKDYFWTLPPDRQAAFWRLSQNNKVAISQMNEADREEAWKMVEKQLAQPPGDSSAMPPPTADDPGDQDDPDDADNPMV